MKDRMKKILAYVCAIAMVVSSMTFYGQTSVKASGSAAVDGKVYTVTGNAILKIKDEDETTTVIVKNKNGKDDDTQTGKPTETPTKDSTENSTEPPTETPTEKLTEPPTETPTEKLTEQLTETPTETPTEKLTEQLTETPTEKPTEPLTEIPTELPTEISTEKPMETPTETLTEKMTEAPTQRIIKIIINNIGKKHTIVLGSAKRYKLTQKHTEFIKKYPGLIKQGYVFAGWYKGSKKASTITSDTELTLRWRPLKTKFKSIKCVGGKMCLYFNNVDWDNVDGMKIVYSRNKNFKNKKTIVVNTKRKKIKKYSVAKSDKKFKVGAVYFFKVQFFYKKDKKKVYYKGSNFYKWLRYYKK